MAPSSPSYLDYLKVVKDGLGYALPSYLDYLKVVKNRSRIRIPYT